MSGLSWLLIGGGAVAVIVVIGLVIIGLLATGALGPVTSSDGVISVKLPKGWANGSAATVSGVKPVLARSHSSGAVNFPSLATLAQSSEPPWLVRRR